MARALQLGPDELRAELRAAVAATPPLRKSLDPYRTGEHHPVKDELLAATGIREAINRRRLHAALSDQTTVTAPGTMAAGPAVDGWRRPGFVDERAAAPFLSAMAGPPLNRDQLGPFGTLEVPSVPTVIPARQASEKVEVASGGSISGALIGTAPVTIAWGADVAMQVTARGTPAFLEMLWAEVASAVVATADREAITDLLATPGLTTAADIPAAVGAVIAAQLSDREPLVLVGTAHVDEFVAMRALVEAGVIRMAVSPAVPAAHTAVVIGGRSVSAMWTRCQTLERLDAAKLGADTAWFVLYALAVAQPAAVVTVPAV